MTPHSPLPNYHREKVTVLVDNLFMIVISHVSKEKQRIKLGNAGDRYTDLHCFQHHRLHENILMIRLL
jgi:hypothetical protein